MTSGSEGPAMDADDVIELLGLESLPQEGVSTNGSERRPPTELIRRTGG